MGQYAYKKTSLALAALLPFLALSPFSAHAAGLGRLVVSSALGQPLRGEIEVVAVQPNEADTLQASLAPPDVFRSANVELNAALLDVRFNIERRDGRFVLVLTSSRPVNEPFLDMLVQLETNAGRLVREYTFLLDPQDYKGGATASAAPAVTSPAVQPIAPQVVAPEKPQAPADVAPAPQRPPVPKSVATYQVKQGDTLGKIARQTVPEGVSLQQMLVALYRGNGDAFMGNNMNRLRAGRILNIPDRDTALAVSAPDARRLVNTQSSAYADYQRAVGAAVAAAPERPEASRQASGKITAAETEKPPAKEAPRDQLRLSKPDDKAKGGKGARGQDAAGDDAASGNKALRDAQDRVATLEKNVTELQKLLALKSAPGAQVQQQAQAAKGSAPAPKAEPPAAKAPETKVEPGKAAPVAPATKTEPPAQQAAPVPKPVVPDAGKVEPKAPPKAAPPPPPPEPSFLDQLLENIYLLGAVALVIVLLVGYALWAWRRKKQDFAGQRFAPSLGAPSAVPSSVLGAAGGQSVDTGTGSMPMDFSAGAPSKGESDEIDPVAEADVYMAYGRDAQAEEILKEALDRNPNRTGVRLKLLEVYSNRNDTAAFEAAARDLQNSTSGQGPDWEKALVLGRALDPSNPLYGGSGAAAEGTAATTGTRTAMEETMVPPLDFDLELSGTASPAVPDIDLDAPPAAASDQTVAIDFNLDLDGDKAPTAEKEGFSPDATVVLPRPVKGAAPAAETAGEAAAPVAEEEAPKEPEAAAGSGMGGLDFDLGLSSEPAAPAAEEPAKSVEPAGIDFDFNLDMGTAAEPAPAEAKTLELALPELSLEEPKSADQTLAIEPANASEPTIAVEPPTLPDAPLPSLSLEPSLEPPGGSPSPEPESPPLDLSAISLDLGDATVVPPSGQNDAKWQEVATKLDLAKAYEEMGDKDGARDLLNEVLEEGDSAQQEQAKSLLATLD